MKVQVRRSLSSRIPNELLDGNLELGVISYDPGDERLKSKVIYTDALAFVVSPTHRLAHRKTVSIPSWGRRSSSRITWSRPIARWCCASSGRTRCRCVWTWRCRPSRPSARWCRTTWAWRFVPRMCVEQEIEQGTLAEVRIKEMHVERKIRLVYPTRRALSHAAKAFLEVVG